MADPGYLPNSQDIINTFQEFGYTPTDAEVQALSQSFTYGEGATGIGIGTSAVAQYVNYMDQVKQFNASDPLTGIQNQMKDLITQNQAQVTNLSTQLQDTLKAAPQLFGSLTPDQISSYLAPLQTSFTQQISQVQATLASRGLGASSTEAQALAQAGQQFQDTVLSTGLNIGLTSQSNQANALQAQINNLFQQTGQAMSVQGQAAGQQSSQNLSESNLIASLPSFLNSQSGQQAAFDKAMNPDTGGFQNLFNQVTGDTSTVVALGQQVGDAASPGLLRGGAPATSINPGATGMSGSPTSPSFASTSPGGTNYQSPNMSLYQGAAGTPAAYGLGSSALFEGSAGSETSLLATGSAF